MVAIILIMAGVAFGEGLRITTDADKRSQMGGSWGLGGLGSSTGLLNRSLQYDSDMNRTGVGSYAGPSSGGRSSNVGGMSGRLYVSPSSSSSVNIGRGVSFGSSNTKYTPKTIGDLKPTDQGIYKPGSDYNNMIRGMKQGMAFNVGKYEITAVGDIGWDRKDTLESQLTVGKKYGIRNDASIARSNAYVEALAGSGYVKESTLDVNADSSHITTLVPKNGGEFAELIKRGEDDFKRELYQESLSLFKLARRISPRSPEVLLSLFHASFAASSGLSYSLPSYYLQLSLKYFPELPLVDVHPKYFYGREGDFMRDQVRLEQYLESQNRDSQAWFILGYIAWRNGQTAEACKYLQNAYDLSQDSELKEAVSIMWDGMRASGKVKDKLIIIIPQKSKTPVSQPSGK